MSRVVPAPTAGLICVGVWSIAATLFGYLMVLTHGAWLLVPVVMCGVWLAFFAVWSSAQNKY